MNAGPAVLAVFARVEDLVGALSDVKARGLPFEIYSPVRDERLQHALGRPKSPVRFFTLAGFLTGAASGFGLCAFTSLRWGFIVSGKPVLSWVPFTVIAFELSILLGVLFTLAGMLYHGRVPRLTLPPWHDPQFSGDRFGLLVQPGSDRATVEAALRGAGAEDVRVVEE